MWSNVPVTLRDLIVFKSFQMWSNVPVTLREFIVFKSFQMWSKVPVTWREFIVFKFFQMWSNVPVTLREEHTWAEAVREGGAEGDIWAEEGRGDRKLEKITWSRI